MPVDLVLRGVGSLRHVLGDASAELNGTVEGITLLLRSSDGSARVGCQDGEGNPAASVG